MSQKNDRAGKMIGWSLGTGMDKPNHKDLIEVPCDYSFKVIGDSDDKYLQDILESIEKKTGHKVNRETISKRESKNGNYTSITFNLHVKTLEEIYEIYAVLKAHPNTKTVL